MAQGIAFAAIPLLSRMFAPEDFGLAQATVSMATLLLIVSSLRLEVALLCVDEADVAPLFRAAWWISAITSLLAFLGALGFIAVWPPTSSDRLVALLVLPFVGLIAGWNQLFAYLGLRRQAFAMTANGKVVQSGGYFLGATAAGFVAPSGAGLLLSELIGRAAVSCYARRALRLPPGTFAFPGLGSVVGVLRSFRELSTVGLLAALLNAAASAFTALMLLWLFSAHEAGQYAMVERLVGVPLALLVASVSQVFMARISAEYSAGNAVGAAKVFRRVLGMQALVGVPLAFGLLVLGPPVLVAILGYEWRAAGDFLRALTPLYVCSYVVGPVNMVLAVTGRQRSQLAWDAGRLLLVAILWVSVQVLGLSALDALHAYSAVGVVCYLAFVAMADLALRKRHTEPLDSSIHAAVTITR